MKRMASFTHPTDKTTVAKIQITQEVDRDGRVSVGSQEYSFPDWF